MKLLKSKHQRLILQCYPPGKNVDKKPNPSELSYLLYYATTRRTKLLKVGVFLEKKVTSDYNHSRTGNLCVSLDIVRGLIEKCAENLDAFAGNVMVILDRILATKDLALCQYALPIFSAFCKEISSDIFSGDVDFLRKFEAVCRGFVAFGYSPQAPNETEWTALSLQSVQAFSPTLAYNNALTDTLVNYSMALILRNIRDVRRPEPDSHLSADTTSELRRWATVRNVASASSALPDQQPSPADAVQAEAFRSLHSLFDTTSNSTGNQLQNSSGALIRYVVANRVSAHWADTLIQLAVGWIPVSSRFKFLDALLQRLSQAHDGAAKAALAGHVTALLASPVTLISLDVPGTLKLLCREQLAMVTDDAACVDDPLVRSYAHCIASLTSHLYYRNQVSDIVSGLLKECADVWDSAPAPAPAPAAAADARSRHMALVLFADIRTVLASPHAESTDALSLDMWEDTFPMLLATDAQLVAAYRDVLLQYLHTAVKNPDAYRKPNYSKYISNQFNPLAQAFACVNDYFQSAVDPEAHVVNALIAVTAALINRYGINTVANGLPHCFDWQFKTAPDGSHTDVASDTFAMVFLLESARFLGLKPLENDVQGKIRYRAQNGLLLDGVAYDVDVSGPADTTDPYVTREAIADYIADESLLLSWLKVDARAAPKDEYNSILNISLSKQPSLVQVNKNGASMVLSASETDRPSNGTTPSASTPTTSQINGLEAAQNYAPRSFSPASTFHISRPSPRVADLKRAISGNSLRATSFGNASIRDGAFASSLVSSRIIDDVGSLLADLDVNGELSSDEDASSGRGKLVR